MIRAEFPRVALAGNSIIDAIDRGESLRTAGAAHGAFDRVAEIINTRMLGRVEIAFTFEEFERYDRAAASA